MCYTAKESALSLGVMLAVSTGLFIRNNELDRVFASLIFVVSLIQLIEYLYHSDKMESKVAGRCIFIILWLQVAVLGIAMYLYYKTTFTCIWATLFSVVFVVSIYYAYKEHFSVTKPDDHLVWTRNGQEGTILGSSAIIYLLGLIAPFIIALYYSEWKSVPLWIMLAVLVASIIFTKVRYPSMVFSSLWCYSAIFIVFAAWLVGAFKGEKNCA